MGHNNKRTQTFSGGQLHNIMTDSRWERLDEKQVPWVYIGRYPYCLHSSSTWTPQQELAVNSGSGNTKSLLISPIPSCLSPGSAHAEKKLPEERAKRRGRRNKPARPHGCWYESQQPPMRSRHIDRYILILS